MLKSSTKECLWRSVPAKEPSSSGRKTVTKAFNAVKDVKKRLDFHDNDELRLEFESKLTELRGIISPKKSPTKSVTKKNTSDQDKVVCWSSSSKEFDDLRHRDYFSASEEQLKSRRDDSPKKTVRNYCVVNFSNDPSDFCVMRVDEQGVKQQQKQIRKHGFVKDAPADSGPNDTYSVRNTRISLEKEPYSLQYEKVSRSRTPSQDADIDQDEDDDLMVDEADMQLLKERLQARRQNSREPDKTYLLDDVDIQQFKELLQKQRKRDKRHGNDTIYVQSTRQQYDESDHHEETWRREQRLRRQVEDIKNTLKETVFNTSSDSFTSHVSVDRAARTLQILSDALSEPCADSTYTMRGNSVEKERLIGLRQRPLTPKGMTSLSKDFDITENIYRKGRSVTPDPSMFSATRNERQKSNNQNQAMTSSTKKYRLVSSEQIIRRPPNRELMTTERTSHTPVLDKLRTEHVLRRSLTPNPEMLSSRRTERLMTDCHRSKTPNPEKHKSVHIIRRPLTPNLSSSSRSERSGSVSSRQIQTNVPLLADDEHSLKASTSSSRQSQYPTRDYDGHENSGKAKRCQCSVVGDFKRGSNATPVDQFDNDSFSDQSNQYVRSQSKSLTYKDIKKNDETRISKSVERRLSGITSDDTPVGPMTIEELDDDKIEGSRSVKIHRRHESHFESDVHDSEKISTDGRCREQRQSTNGYDERSQSRKNNDQIQRPRVISRNKEHRSFDRTSRKERNELRKVDRAGEASTGQDPENKNDKEERSKLTLGEVQQLHREVENRIREQNDEYRTHLTHQKTSQVSSGRKAKNISKEQNEKSPSRSISPVKLINKNGRRSVSPTKHRGVLIPVRQNANHARGMSLDRALNGRNSARNIGVLEKQNLDRNEVKTVASGPSSQDFVQGKEHISISIPDLYGLRITGTIERQRKNDLHPPERRRLNLSVEESFNGEVSTKFEVDGHELNDDECPVTDDSKLKSRQAGEMRNTSNRMNMMKDIDESDSHSNILNEKEIWKRNDEILSRNKTNKAKTLLSENRSLKERFLSGCVEKLGQDYNGGEDLDYVEHRSIHTGRTKTEVGENYNQIRYSDAGQMRDVVNKEYGSDDRIFGQNIENGMEGRWTPVMGHHGHGKDGQRSVGRPASVFEPPERDTSTPLKKLQGSSPLSSSQPQYVQSAADTIMSQLHNPDTLRLLQSLYQADDGKRAHLIVLTQYFRTWQTNARRQKQHRENHDIFMRRAFEFQVSHLTQRYFYTWYQLAHDHRTNRIATDLCTRHMLKKGLDAFRWSISRSLHRQDMMKVRVHSIRLSASFNKWRSRAEERRRHRLQHSLSTWRTFTLEAQRERSFRKCLDEKLLRNMMCKWKAMHVLRLKQHRADFYHRRTLLSHIWLSWSDFTTLSVQRRVRKQCAIAKYRESLQRRVLEEMKQVHQKHLLAKEHFRLHTLSKLLRGWRESALQYKVARQQDVVKSEQHLYAVTLIHYFIHWRETLWNLRATHMAVTNITRHSFMLWREKWQKNTCRRMHIEKQIEMNKLKRAIRLWRENVVQRRRRQAAAIFSLENVLLRQVIGDWHRYTAFKVDLRTRMHNHICHYNSLKEAACYHQWRKEFEKRMDEQTAQKFWSQRCARKASARWRLIVRKRQLKTMLVDSEPLRRLTLQQVMFRRWQEAKHCMDREKSEAATMKLVLERGQLERRFNTWRMAALQLLCIKPLQHQRNTKLISQCFGGWRQLTAHKRECKQNRDKFIKYRLQKVLKRWRRQYLIHQMEKVVQHRMLMGLGIVCLEEWNFVIRRKKAANLFHDLHLVQNMFFKWRDRCEIQMEEKALVQAEKEHKANLRSYYFRLWWSNVQEQISDSNEVVSLLHQRHAHNRIRKTFQWWRTQLQHTRASRAYHKIMCQRSMRAVLLEWHHTTDSSLCVAVQSFRQELGLVVHNHDEEDRETALGGQSDGSVASSSGFHSNKELSLWPDFDDNVDDDAYSTRSSTSVGRAFRRMMFGGDSDGDSEGFLPVSGMSQHTVLDQRRQRVKTLVITAVTRLRLWPVGVVFDQWLEFTARQRELKSLGAQLRDIHHRTTLSMFFADWKRTLMDMDTADIHCHSVLKKKVITALVQYRQRRAEKKKLSALAGRYNQLIVFKQFFPIWQEKTQNRQHQHNILRLWSTTTEEEQELLPLESQLCQRFTVRSLRLCFAIWLLKFQFAAKIKHAYHMGLLKRVVCGWHQWSLVCRDRRDKCHRFLTHRVQALVVRTWQKRLSQKLDSDKKHTETWQSYLHLILQKWKQWAEVVRQQRLSAAIFVRQRETRMLSERLNYWHRLTDNLQAVRHLRQTHLTHSVFAGWQSYIEERKSCRQKILNFQVSCYTSLVKRLFGHWRQAYIGRLRQRSEREKLVQNETLRLGRVWRKKARATRGRHLHLQFQQNKVRQFFAKWRNAYHQCLEREEVLERHLQEKSLQCLRSTINTWRTRRLADQAGRVYNMKLMMAVIEEWRVLTKGSKERRIRGLALKKALQERQLTVRFHMWWEMTQVRRMVQGHSDLKLKLRVMQLWRSHARKQRILREKQMFLTKKVNLRILQSTFVTIRCRYDYCQGLNDMASSLQESRETQMVKSVLTRWQTRLDVILASRCYGKLLVVRTLRQWRRYVARKKEERRLEKEKMDRATKHYNNKLCQQALRGLMNEVRVKHQHTKHKHRLAAKYGHEWKRRTDLAYTATSLEHERLYNKMWTRWRIAYSQRRAEEHVGSFERRQLMSQVFSAWRQLVRRHSNSGSTIPVATSTAATTSMSVHASVSNLPVRISTSQIPMPQSRYANRK